MPWCCRCRRLRPTAMVLFESALVTEPGWGRPPLCLHRSCCLLHSCHSRLPALRGQIGVGVGRSGEPEQPASQSGRLRFAVALSAPASAAESMRSTWRTPLTVSTVSRARCPPANGVASPASVAAPQLTQGPYRRGTKDGQGPSAVTGSVRLAARARVLGRTGGHETTGRRGAQRPPPPRGEPTSRRVRHEGKGTALHEAHHGGTDGRDEG